MKRPNKQGATTASSAPSSRTTTPTPAPPPPAIPIIHRTTTTSSTSSSTPTPGTNAGPAGGPAGPTSSILPPPPALVDDEHPPNPPAGALHLLINHRPSDLDSWIEPGVAEGGLEEKKRRNHRKESLFHRPTIPVLQWLPRYNFKHDFMWDLLAGLTVGIMLIPQGMAYGVLAGVTPIYGLYAAIVPNVTYMIFGPSRESAVGAMALVSIMVGDIVSQHTSTDASLEERVNIATKLAFLTGILQIVLGLLKMGEIATYVSHPVMQGFCSGGEILIAISQLKYLLGIKVPAFPYAYQTVYYIGRHIRETQLWTLLLASVTFGLLFAISKWRRVTKAKWERIKNNERLALTTTSLPTTTSATATAAALPTAAVEARTFTRRTKILLLLANFAPCAAIVITGFVAYGMSRQGVAPPVIGKVPHGVHTYKSYLITVDELQSLISSSLLLAVISFMLTFSVSKKYANANNYEVEPNQELFAIGLSDAIGSFFGSFPVAGGFARTAVAVEANQKSQLAALIAAAIVLLSVLFLTSSFYFIPLSTLACIVQVAIFGVVDFKPFLYAFRTSKSEFFIMAVTFLVTLAVGVDKGIMVGIALNILALVRQTSHPHIRVLGVLPGKRHVFRDVCRYEHAIQLPNILIMRIDESINFASCGSIKEQLLKIAADPSVVLPAPRRPGGGGGGGGNGGSYLGTRFQSLYNGRSALSPFRSLEGPLTSVLTSVRSSVSGGGHDGRTNENGNGSEHGDGGGGTEQKRAKGKKKEKELEMGSSKAAAGRGISPTEHEEEQEEVDADEEAARALTPAPPVVLQALRGPRHVVIDCSGVNHLDLSGVRMLDEVQAALERNGQGLYITNVKSSCRDVLRSTIWERVGGDLCFLSLPALLDHLVGNRHWAGEMPGGDMAGGGGGRTSTSTPGPSSLPTFGGGMPSSQGGVATGIYDDYTDWMI